MVRAQVTAALGMLGTRLTRDALCRASTSISVRYLLSTFEQSELGARLAELNQKLCPTRANGAKILVPGLAALGTWGVIRLLGGSPGSWGAHLVEYNSFHRRHPGAKFTPPSRSSFIRGATAQCPKESCRSIVDTCAMCPTLADLVVALHRNVSTTRHV